MIYKRKVLLILLVQLSLFFLFAEADDLFPTVLFTQMESVGDSNDNKVLIYSEEFRLALLNAGRFRLVEFNPGIRKDDFDYINSFFDSYHAYSGRDADLFLVTQVSGSGDELKFLIELYDSDSTPILTKAIESSEENYSDDLSAIAEEIAMASSFSGEGALVWLETYVATEQWERAYRIWVKQYDNKNSELSQNDSLGVIIKENLASQKKDSAIMLLKGGYYEEARFNAENALELMPESMVYQEFLKEVEIKYSEYREDFFLSRLSTVYELIEEKMDSAALSFCVKIEEEGFADPRLDIAYSKAQDLQVERAQWELARSSFRKGEYNQALRSIENSLHFDPDYSDYCELKIRIEKQIEIQKKTRSSLNDYNDSLATLNYKSALLLHRSNPYLIHSSLGKREFTGLKLEENYEDFTESVWLFAGSYDYYFRDISFLSFRHPAVSLQPYLSSEICLGWDYMGESTLNDNNPGISGYYDKSAFISEVNGKFGAILQFLSFNLGVGGSIGCGGIWLSENEEYPVEESLNESIDVSSFIMSMAWNARLGWKPGDKFEIFTEYVNGFYPLIENDDLKNIMWSHLSFGIGFQM